MNKLTELDKWLILFEDFLEARGYTEETIKHRIASLKTINETWGDIVNEDFETIYSRMWVKAVRASYRQKQKQILNYFKFFMNWAQGEGLQEFANWLRMEGYSESSIKRYVYSIRQSAERISRNEKELKMFETARRTFKRFMRFYFS